jgi:hypothetical protein
MTFSKLHYVLKNSKQFLLIQSLSRRWRISINKEVQRVQPLKYQCQNQANRLWNSIVISRPVRQISVTKYEEINQDLNWSGPNRVY